ncbi:IclR family transcriptional regulator [Mesobacterium pallidum]|uniref:IclR family transcriptional regulator n=1 Tax=Mesobacterium pallidum TaxID=2872037 RepID=UPI001EE36B5E|nr:helix-turn-helix domain-containing protein [Mesobacterium pallidum]
MAYRPVKSALRVLDILRLFSVEKRALSQSEIIGLLGLPQSSAVFLLRSMIESGYLTYRREERVYFPTPEVLHLGNWLEGFGYDAFFGESAVSDLMHDIAERTGETVSVSSQNDIFVHFHRIIRLNLPSALRVEEGSVMPLTYSSYGRVLLSRQSPTQIDRVCRLIRARETRADLKFDVDDMIAQIMAMRESRFCFSYSPILPNAASVATTLPVRIAGRDVAIGVGGPADRIRPALDLIAGTLRTTLDRHEPRLIAAFGASADPGRSGAPSARDG